MGLSSGREPSTTTSRRPPLSTRETEKSLRTPQPGIIAPGQSNVFARLQALFPHGEENGGSGRAIVPDRPAFQLPTHPPLSPNRATQNGCPHPDEAPFLKIKIITWNMHESLPHGDLRSLLGSIPPHVPIEVKNGVVPPLPKEDSHPFHVVIVAGQECPTHSGIPLGLGAAFRDRHKDKEAQPEREASKTEREKEKERQRHIRRSRGEIAAVTMSSWSAILEDWLQNGVGSMADVQPVLRERLAIVANRSSTGGAAMEISASAPPSLGSGLEGRSHEVSPLGPYLGWNIPDQGGIVTLSAEQARMRAGVEGPYVLLCKERLMGIYIAVFVQRDCRTLIQGYSTGTVTAGLMGGRVGNKGGVGVSMNFAGNRLLFINAHLAAHEGKVALRLANLHKIKSELEVDAFLPPTDPRLAAEDVTDRFDVTFIFGDLNFRLDLTRLHADWLISRKEYAQALEFDQLHKLIMEGKVDFQEEPPHFPPTYKYDVRKRSVRDSMVRRPGHKRRATTDTIERVDEAHEPVVANDRDEVEEDEHETHDFESSSFVSTGSAWTTTGSTVWTTDADDDDDDNDNDDDNVVAASLAAAAQAAHKLLTLPAAQKAKTKFMDFLGRPESPAGSSRPASITPETLPTPPIEITKSVPPASYAKPAMSRSTSTKTHLSRAAVDDDEPPTTYDSSSKQRVPSWCDRILWKTTIPPESSPTPQSEESAKGSSRKGYFATTWPASLRRGANAGGSRRDSTSSTTAENHGPDSPGPGDSMPAAFVSHSWTPRAAETASEGQRTVYPNIADNASDSRPGLRKSTTFDPDDNPLAPWYAKFRRSQSRGSSTPSSPSLLRTSESPPRLPPVLVDSSSLMPTPQADEAKTFTTGSSNTKWWRHLPALLSRASVHEPAWTTANRREHHRKGDVVVLSYRTLDDAQMRALDARSDHRPVIGAYAVYV